MPELPEVETIRRQLEEVLVGKTIKDVQVIYGRKINLFSFAKYPRWPSGDEGEENNPSEALRSRAKEGIRLRKNSAVIPRGLPRGASTATKFIAEIKGAKFKAVRRRAKILILDLSSGQSLLVHLKMTGRLLYVARDVSPGKHTHVIFYLNNGKKLLWEDTRKFGYIKMLPTAKLDDFFHQQGYGPEPLENSFSFEIFKQCLRKSPRKKIKPLLMEQTCLAGIGNIYADESLWYAGVQPIRRAGSLGSKELRELYNGLRKILLAAIKYQGTSADTYLDAYGRAGEFQPRLQAYGKEGTTCARRDGGIIKKIKLGGRSAHFCPKHQK